MKILHITHKFPPGFAGGSGNSAFILSKQQKSFGHDVKVISFDGELPEGSNESYQGLEIIRYKVDRDASKLINNTLTKNISDIIKEYGPDAIHLHSIWTVGLTPLKALNKFQGKVIMKLPDYVMICARGTMLNKDKNICTDPKYTNCIKCVSFKQFMTQIYVRRFFYRKAKSIQLLAPSKHMKKMFLKANPSLNVRYFPNFFSPAFKDISKLDKIKLKIDNNISDKKVILFSGRIIETKGYQYALEAMKYVSDNKALLLLAGNNIDGDKLFDYIRRYNIEDRVKFLGNFPLEDLPKVYRMSDILVVPSIWPENSPNVIYEALAAGLPVIGSDLGGIPDLVINNKNGFLIPPRDPKRIAEKINLLLKNKELLQKLSDNSKKGLLCTTPASK